MVINTDTSDMPGRHWVLLSNVFGHILFADSYGKDLYFYPNICDRYHKLYVKRQWIKIVDQRMQLSNFLCGTFCVYYAHALLNTKATDINNSNILCCNVVNDFDLPDFVYKDGIA